MPALQDYLSSDLANDGYLEKMLSAGKIRPLTPVTNAVTATNHASFETGVVPAKHGIIGHTFGSADNQYAAPISGFSQLFEKTAIWETAAANGMEVLNIGSLLLHGSREDTPGVHKIAQGQALGDSRMIHLQPSSNSIRSTQAEFIRPLKTPEGTPVKLYNETEIYFFMADTLNDGLEDFQLLLLDDDHLPGNGVLGRLRPGRWAEIICGKSGEFDVSTRLKLLEWNRDTRQIKIFARSPFVNRGAPPDIVQFIEQIAGACKGWLSIPDYFAGTIDDATIREEIEAEVDYVLSIFRLGLDQERYRLIMLDYPILDRYGHLFSLSHPRQKGFSPEAAERYSGYIREAYRRLDNDLAEINQLAGAAGYRVIAASGHGFSAIHSTLNINRWLDESGFAANPADGNWMVRAFPGKVSAHFYVNEQRLPPAQRATLLKKLQMQLTGLKDPESGEIIAEAVYSRDDLAGIGMDHQNSGDLWMLLKPGYVFQRAFFSDAPLFDKPLFRGDHGYAASNPGNDGLIISQVLGKPGRPASVPDIYPTVAELLNLAPDSSRDGRSLISK